MCRALKNEKVHAWHGMIGYVMKDAHEAHFHMVHHNISDDDISPGSKVYLQYGAGPLKDSTVLDARNIFGKALNF